MTSPAKQPVSKESTYQPPKLSYPYKVDYNDHFETPLIAYTDILPMIDAVATIVEESNDDRSKKKKKKKKKRRHQQSNTMDNDQSDEPNNQKIMINTDNSSSSSSSRHDHIIYDPYYCNGRTKRLLHNLGFTNVQHEKRDFYKDIINKTVPFFHTLVTNPPYSQDHKEKCVTFAVEKLRQPKGGSTPFFILMPNYVACRNHFRTAIAKKNGKYSSQDDNDDDPSDIMYVVPSIPYEYEHPEGTGKDVPPFASIWFCGIPIDKVDQVKDAFRRTHGKDSVGFPTSFSFTQRSKSNTPRLLSSLAELKKIKAVPTMKRPNPRQRRKIKMAMMNTLNSNQSVTVSKINTNKNKAPMSNKRKGGANSNQSGLNTNNNKERKKKRRY